MVGYGDRKRTHMIVSDLFDKWYQNQLRITQSYVSKLLKKFQQIGSIKKEEDLGVQIP